MAGKGSQTALILDLSVKHDGKEGRTQLDAFFVPDDATQEELEGLAHDIDELVQGLWAQRAQTANPEDAISSETHSTDHVVEISFNAAPWFEQATDKEILDLAKEGWGEDEAEHVARFFDDTITKGLFAYLALGPTMADGDTVGFSCQIFGGDALRWITNHRPHLIPQLPQEYQDDLESDS